MNSPVVMRVRTCYRCGEDFRTQNGIVCPSCRRRGSDSHRQPVVYGQPLTTREKQVMALLGDGLSNKEIAAQLKLSHGSVRQYVYSVMQKSRLSRFQIALRAHCEACPMKRQAPSAA